MYNRYIPSADGTYQRKVVPSPPKVQTRQEPPPPKQEPPPPKPQPMPRGILPQLHLDTGDILVLLILLLVLTEGEDADPLSILVTIAAFLLMQ